MSQPYKLRSKQAIYRRALVLFGVFGVSAGADPLTVKAWLVENDLSRFLTTEEDIFLVNGHQSEASRIEFSWHSERLTILLWSMQLLPQLPKLSEQCDTKKFKMLPPFCEVTVKEFLIGINIRAIAEIVDQLEHYERVHWKLRDSFLKGQSPSDVNEIVQERHHALMWLVDPFDRSWLRITTDT
jgi:hypothetical protein